MNKFAKIPEWQLKSMSVDIAGKDGKSTFDRYKTKVPVIKYELMPDEVYYKLAVPVEGQKPGPDYDEVVVEEIDRSYPSDRMRDASYFMDDLAEQTYSTYKKKGGKLDADKFDEKFLDAFKYVNTDPILKKQGMVNGIVTYLKLFE
jgi:hypothetical protein